MALALDLSLDPRWRRLHDPSFACPACGQKHAGLPELNMEKPFPWQGGDRQDPNSPDIDPRNYLLEDFCVIDNRQFFIRAVLELPILGGGKSAALSCWVSVASGDFDRYGDSFDSPTQSAMGSFAGTIANRFGAFGETLDLPCAVRPQDNRQRPLIGIDHDSHPLALAQRKGVTLDQLLDFYAACRHDLRPGLKVVN